MKPDAKIFSKLAINEGWVSIVTNILLFIIKYWTGILTGSVAIIADAWHTLSDSLSSVFVIVGIKLSQKPADSDHPFGHGRAELVSAILIGCLLGFISYSFIIESIERLQNSKFANYGVLAIVVTIISIIGKEALAQYAFYIGRKTGSRSVSADGWHHRSDAISSLVILAGIFLGRFYWWIDGVLGIIVALLILYAGIKVIISSSNTIMGEIPTKDLVEDVKVICDQSSGFNICPHHFHLHNYITHKELTFHVRLPESMTILDAHNLSSIIEERILYELSLEATIHFESLKEKRAPDL